MKIIKTSILLSGSILLFGCNSGSNNSANNFTPSQLVWEDCANPIKYPSMSRSSVDYFGSNLQCAMMEVPVDYNDLSKGYLNIAVSRIKATDQANRIGILLFNPGGPGGSGLAYAPWKAMLLDSSNPDTEIGSQLHKLPERYDFIGFDPRGVGSSTNLICKLNALYQQELLATQDTSINNFNNIYYNQQLDAVACQSNNLTPYINTDATARDMDNIRIALGEDKLNFIGYSYGTWLGVWYASLFSDHVNHLVLDSTVDFSQPINYNEQAIPMQYVYDNFVVPYASQHPEFGLGTSIENINKIFFAANIYLQTAFSNITYSYMFKQSFVDYVVMNISGMNAINNILIENPLISDKQLSESVANYPYSTDEALNNSIAFNSIFLLEDYFKIKNTPTEVNLPDSVSSNEWVNKAVVCNDQDSETNPEFWNAQVRALKTKAPIYYHDRYELNCTAKWGGATVVKPSVQTARQINNILMVQSQYDPATPLKGAINTYNLLGNATMIYNQNNYTHALFPSGNSCVDLNVVNYLINPTVPNTGNEVVICEGNSIIRSGVNSSSSFTQLPSELLNNATHEVGYDYLSKAYNNVDDVHKIMKQIDLLTD